MFTFDTHSSDKLCGKVPPVVMVTESANIIVIFHSDHVVPQKGFRVKIFTVNGMGFVHI